MAESNTIANYFSASFIEKSAQKSYDLLLLFFPSLSFSQTWNEMLITVLIWWTSTNKQSKNSCFPKMSILNLRNREFRFPCKKMICKVEHCSESFPSCLIEFVQPHEFGSNVHSILTSHICLICSATFCFSKFAKHGELIGNSRTDAWKDIMIIVGSEGVYTMITCIWNCPNISCLHP